MRNICSRIIRKWMNSFIPFYLTMSLIVIGCAGQNDSIGGVDSCSGTVTSCFSLHLSGTECVQQEGCSYSSSCGGSAESCVSTTLGGTQEACENQKGCSYDAVSKKCKGIATGCSSFTEGQCKNQKRCRILGQCLGTAMTCQRMQTMPQCQQQKGCKWN